MASGRATKAILSGSLHVIRSSRSPTEVRFQRWSARRPWSDSTSKGTARVSVNTVMSSPFSSPVIEIFGDEPARADGEDGAQPVGDLLALLAEAGHVGGEGAAPHVLAVHRVARRP